MSICQSRWRKSAHYEGPTVAKVEGLASMITSKAATNDHLKTGHHEMTETGSV